MNQTNSHGTLQVDEPHPSVHYALQYINSARMLPNWFETREALASCAIEGNREAEIACETLRRLEAHEPVSDRYLMGLAWMLWKLNAE